MAMALALAVALWGHAKELLKLMLMGAPAGSARRRMAPPQCGLGGIQRVHVLLNAYVVLNYSTEDWVSFKVWGYVFPLAFIIAQGFYIAPHLKGTSPRKKEPPNEHPAGGLPTAATGAATARAPEPQYLEVLDESAPACGPRRRPVMPVMARISGSQLLHRFTTAPGGTPPACV
jgi:hypothetical protein